MGLDKFSAEELGMLGAALGDMAKVGACVGWSWARAVQVLLGGRVGVYVLQGRRWVSFVLQVHCMQSLHGHTSISECT
jgi:hypothetical protein